MARDAGSARGAGRVKRDDLQALLRLKRVREQVAAAELERARSAVGEALAEQDGATRSLRAFGVLRRAKEGAIYKRLAGDDTVSAGRLLAASTDLTELAAREGALGQRLRDTERQVREKQRLAEAARTEYRARQRRAE